MQMTAPMTGWDEANEAARAAGLGIPAGPSHPRDGGALACTDKGWFFVADATDPDGSGQFLMREVHNHHDPAQATAKSELIAIVPGQPLLNLGVAEEFRLFARLLGFRIRAEVLASLLVRRLGQYPDAALVFDGLELDEWLDPAVRIRVGPLHHFRPRKGNAGDWRSRFSSYAWIHDPRSDSWGVAIEDWDLRLEPSGKLVWAHTRRCQPVPLKS